MKEFCRAKSRKRGRRGREKASRLEGRLRRHMTRCSGDSKTRIPVEALKLEGTQGRSPGTLNLFFLVQRVNIYSTVATIDIKNRRTIVSVIREGENGARIVRAARALGSELAYRSARSALRRPSQFPNCPYLSLHSVPCFTPYLDIFKSPFSDTFPIFSLATTHVYKIASWLLSGKKNQSMEGTREGTHPLYYPSVY
ncbi:hypothetical protein BC826DRAFT_79363 [Russula brevipes]|nr:hypothetical protein BC826DRAFT_79363 [Russula brevipes]